MIGKPLDRATSTAVSTRAMWSALALLALLVPACSPRAGEKPATDPSAAPKERVEMRVDDAVLAGASAFAVIEPAFWSVDIYGSAQAYEASLQRFSRPQRLLLALHWYVSEVNNGGHDQFYSNSTGIVWPDALAAFEAIEVPEGADILRESALRLGGSPALEREERGRQMAQLAPRFDDLDQRFFALQEQVDLDARMLAYARRQPAEFYFEGVVGRPLP